MTRVRSCECPPSRGFSSRPESASYRKAGTVPRALLPARLEVSEELPQTQNWESPPHKSRPPSSTTGLRWHHMLRNIVLLQPRGPSSALPCAAQLSAQELFYHYFHRFITFLGIQISVTVPGAWGEEWCPPSLPLQPNELPFFISKSNEHQTT